MAVPTLKVEAACARSQGHRSHQEDEFCIADDQLESTGTALYGVFDGHGSDAYSTHASKHMARHIFGNEAFKRKNFEEALIQECPPMTV